MAAELEIKLTPDTVKLFEQDEISQEAAQRLTKIALMILDYEAAKYDMSGHDPEILRQWLSDAKRKTEVVTTRFNITVTLEAVTRNGATNFSFKFHKAPARP